MKPIFPFTTPCCSHSGDRCTEFLACKTNERGLRRYAASDAMPPLTTAQREVLLNEADNFGEGLYPQEAALNLPDAALAQWTLNAWYDYARNNSGW